MRVFKRFFELIPVQCKNIQKFWVGVWQGKTNVKVQSSHVGETELLTVMSRKQ